jgi:hypothetical protein
MLSAWTHTGRRIRRQNQEELKRKGGFPPFPQSGLVDSTIGVDVVGGLIVVTSAAETGIL